MVTTVTKGIREMKNPLVKSVEHELNQLGISNAKLVRESYNAESFGNAEAVYDLGNLRFYFVRDRGQDILNCSPSGLMRQNKGLA